MITPLRSVQYQHNKLFESNQRRFYQQLQDDDKQSETPNCDNAKDFWKGIWGQATVYNEKAPWLDKARENLSRAKTQNDVQISTSSLQAILKNTPNWKAPGPDGVQGYWIKSLTGLHRKLAEYIG